MIWVITGLKTHSQIFALMRVFALVFANAAHTDGSDCAEMWELLRLFVN
jgi:hypothetical protein